MGLFRPFEEFDPWTGCAPEQPFRFLPSLVARARALLKERTRYEISTAAHNADWFIEEYFRRELDAVVQRINQRGLRELAYLAEPERNEAGIRWLLKNWPADADDQAPHFPSAENTTELDALKRCIDGYDFDDPKFPKTCVFEYFAVLGLWKVADSIRWLTFDREKLIREAAAEEFPSCEFPRYNIYYAGVTANEVEKKQLTEDTNIVHSIPSDDAYRYSLAGAEAIQAMDAVCWAEHLNATQQLQEERDQFAIHLREQASPTYQKGIALKYADQIVTERISLRNSQAAIKRHTEHRAMKAQVIDWYVAHREEYRSMDAAAEAIAGKLVPLVFRTVRDYISEYRRKVRSARIP